MSETNGNMVELAADIVSAYVANNNVTPSDLPGLIASVFVSLTKLGGEPEAPAAAPLVPAISIRKSVTPDAIICLEDGKSFKSLKRHLSSKYGLTPEQYRTKWGLPSDYPMVAPAYAEARSALAKSMGLGRKAAAAPAKAKRAAKARSTT
jgi:predicted transcriptional regulator